MHIQLSIRCITSALTVEIITDKCSPPVAQHSQRFRIPVVFKTFSCQKYRGNNPFVKYALYKFAEHCIRFFCLIFIQDRIYHRKFLHVSACHFIYCNKRRFSASQTRPKPPKHIRFDLISVTAKQRCVILPQFLRLIKQVIAKTLLVILDKNITFINIHPYGDSSEHLRHFFRKRRNCKNNTVDLRK